MKIADVFHEKSKEYYRQENSIEYAYITADEFTAAQVVEIEKDILAKLNFRLLSPNTLLFVKAYQTILNLDTDTFKLALYLTDLVLLSFESLKFKYSLLSIGILHLSCLATNRFPMITDTSVFLNYSNSQFLGVVDHIKQVWLEARSNPQFSRFDSVNQKHSSINPRNLWPPSSNFQNWI